MEAIYKDDMKGQATEKMVPLGYFLESIDALAGESLNSHELSEKQIYDMIHAPIVLELYPLYKPYSPEDSSSKDSKFEFYDHGRSPVPDDFSGNITDWQELYLLMHCPPPKPELIYY